MINFTYRKPEKTEEALTLSVTKAPGPVHYIGGGTTLVDLMKLDVERPAMLVDVNALPFKKIEISPDGGISIGAGVTNAELAQHNEIRTKYRALSDAILAGASAQLRNRATTAGNLLQRTRCVYFRDPHKACNKRQPGSGCSAIDGFNRNLAVMGVSSSCIATNPSDMNVPLAALGASVHVQGMKGRRTIEFSEFHRLPGDTPHLETALQPGELITHVTLPALAKGTKSVYLKLRDRASYEFALASAAIFIRMNGQTMTDVRIAMGGIGTKPWRDPKVEALLQGKSASNALFKDAAKAFMTGAKAQSQNAFKIELAQRCLVHALESAVRA